MKYTALLSPKQFFSFKGQRYQAQGGIFHTNDAKVIDFLKDNPFWKAEGKSKAKEDEPEKPKEKKKGKK